MEGATELKTRVRRRDHRQHVGIGPLPAAHSQSSSRLPHQTSGIRQPEAGSVNRRVLDESQSHSRRRGRQRRRHGGARRSPTRSWPTSSSSTSPRRRPPAWRSTCSRRARSKARTRAWSGRRDRRRLEADRRLRRGGDHLGRAAQAGHEPRRPAADQLQDHAVGHRADRQVLAEHASSCRSPTRSTRCARRSTG